MNVPANRRTLLKLAAALPVSLPLYSLAGGEERSGLAYHPVKNQMTANGTKAGAIALVDPAVTKFSGPGYYLYPDWGNPVVYEVREGVKEVAREVVEVAREEARSLTFHYPGMENTLWEISVADNPVIFGGRVEGIIDSQSLSGLQEKVSLARLDVPALPASPANSNA